MYLAWKKQQTKTTRLSLTRFRRSLETRRPSDMHHFMDAHSIAILNMPIDEFPGPVCHGKNPKSEQKGIYIGFTNHSVSSSS